jgi:dihydropteroate synthase
MKRPLVMGILNVTPDSFSDGGRYLATEAAIAHGLEMVAEGADIVDVGGESSRPGAEPVAEAVELERVLPVIEALAPLVRVSIDTVKPAVATAAVRAGATVVNDVSSTLWPVAAAGSAGWVAMHMQGSPATMQTAPHYDDVVTEVFDFLLTRARAALAGGVREVWVDPGIGFGKTAAHNLSLLHHLHVHGHPSGGSGGRHRRRLCRGAGGNQPQTVPRRTGRAARQRHAARGGRAGGGLPGHGRVGHGGGGRRGSGARRGGHGAVWPVVWSSSMKGKWAAGIPPRNFTWVMKDHLAISERPGGYAPNHRKVRRREEIIWLRNQGFGRVISLLPSPHNLAAYDDEGLAWAHYPLPKSGDPRPVLAECFADIDSSLAAGLRLLVHQDELGDRVMGVVAGYLVWSKRLHSQPQAVALIEHVCGHAMGEPGRELLATLEGPPRRTADQ